MGVGISEYKRFWKSNGRLIEELEEYLGFQLPNDYKEFLNDYNGGTVR